VKSGKRKIPKKEKPEERTKDCATKITKIKWLQGVEESCRKGTDRGEGDCSNTTQRFISTNQAFAWNEKGGRKSATRELKKKKIDQTKYVAVHLGRQVETGRTELPKKGKGLADSKKEERHERRRGVMKEAERERRDTWD